MSLFLLALLACGPKPAAPSDTLSGAPEIVLNASAVAGVQDPTLRRLLHEHWEHTMSRAPVWATTLGDRRFDDSLGDPSGEAVADAERVTRGLRARAAAIDRAALSPADALTLALFEQRLDAALEQAVCAYWKWSISPRFNAFVDLSTLPEDHPVLAPEHGDSLLARYRAIPAYVDAEIANLREGLRTGFVSNAHSVALVVQQLDAALAEPVETWTLLEPDVRPGAYADPAAIEALRAALRVEVEARIAPAFARYRDALRDEVLPAGRPAGAEGVAALPDGEACYAAVVRGYTTTSRTPDEIHAIGLAEIESINAELAALGERLFGTRDRAAIYARLRTDPALYFTSADEVEAAANHAVAKARAAMPRAFGRLPGAEVVVRPIPPHEAPYTTIAYYRQPSPDGARPGEYFVNTYAPETRPRYEAEVLAYHEAIPGHHLQIAIARELPEVPAFRKYGGFTAFVEGWGLYAERLADELGLYTDDLSRAGMLSFDLWRAGRLVVDTGLHAKGWTRQEAVDFLLANTPQAENNIVNEVDRYVTWPGQALAYKTGQLAIRDARARAEVALGDDFELSAFHDLVLGAGALPLSVMDARIDAWIEGVGR